MSVRGSAPLRNTIASWTRDDRPGRKRLVQRHAVWNAVHVDHYAWSVGAAFRVKRLVRLFRLVHALLDVVDDLVGDACARVLLFFALFVVRIAGRRIVGTGYRCRDQRAAVAATKADARLVECFSMRSLYRRLPPRQHEMQQPQQEVVANAIQSHEAKTVVSKEITAHKRI